MALKETKITKKEKEFLEPFVERRVIAAAAFSQASEMVRNADKGLWKELKNLWPNGTRIDCPSDKAWTILIAEEEPDKQGDMR